MTHTIPLVGSKTSVIRLVCTGTLVVALVALGGTALWHLRPYKLPTPVLTPSTSLSVGVTPVSLESELLTMCTGLTALDPDVKPLAIASCLGRIRGFSDGHQMTTRMLSETEANRIALWCVSPQTTDIEVFQSVVKWSEANPERFYVLSKSAAAPTATMLIVVAALHAQYPCSK